MGTVQQLASQLVRKGLRNRTYAHAERAARAGYISQRDWRLYCLFWDWSAVRVSSCYRRRQDRFRDRCGDARFLARLERFQQALKAAEQQELQRTRSR